MSSAQAPRLSVVSDEQGRVYAVRIGELDITHLVERVQSVTHPGRVEHEVVLRVWLPPARRTEGART